MPIVIRSLVCNFKFKFDECFAISTTGNRSCNRIGSNKVLTSYSSDSKNISVNLSNTVNHDNDRTSVKYGKPEHSLSKSCTNKKIENCLRFKPRDLIGRLDKTLTMEKSALVSHIDDINC